MIFTTRLLSHSQIIPHHQSAMCQVLSGRIWSIFGWTNKLSMWYQISYLLHGISCFFCFKYVKIGLSGKSNVIFHSFPKLELSNTWFFPFRRDDVAGMSSPRQGHNVQLHFPEHARQHGASLVGRRSRRNASGGEGHDLAVFGIAKKGRHGGS